MNRSAVATETCLQHGCRMSADSCYATPSAPRNRSAAFRECTLFLLCRFICRFICSLPGSTSASCSASREHVPRSQKSQEMPQTRSPPTQANDDMSRNIESGDTVNRGDPNNRWPRSAWLTKGGRRCWRSHSQK